MSTNFEDYLAMTERNIAIIIPNLNSPVIGEVLKSLLVQTDLLDAPIEIWVVGQDCYGQVNSSQRVHFLETLQPVSPAIARNLGASVASGDVLIFLDADCVPQPGWLTAMLDALRCWPEAGAISGAMLPDGETFNTHCSQVAIFHEHLSLNHPGRRRTLASFSLLMSRATWQSLRGFDEGFRFAAAEDLDLAIRITLQGQPLYFEPCAIVRHSPPCRGWWALWKYAERGGSQSIIVRRRYGDYYKTSNWMRWAWAWRLFSPAIALARALQIYLKTPGLWRYWSWGAAAGLDSDVRDQTGKEHL